MSPEAEMRKRKLMPVLDNKVSYLDIVAILGALASVLFTWFNMEHRISSLETTLVKSVEGILEQQKKDLQQEQEIRRLNDQIIEERLDSNGKILNKRIDEGERQRSRDNQNIKETLQDIRAFLERLDERTWDSRANLGNNRRAE